MRPFYYNAASDSSKIFFPSNTISHFSVQLTRAICPVGEWEVALCEVFTPPSGFIQHVGPDEAAPIYLYCDVIAPQLVSDTEARLLRVLPALMPSGNVVFASRYYIPVEKQSFSTITFTFAGKEGTRYPFTESYHPSLVVLHFRERKDE